MKKSEFNEIFRSYVRDHLSPTSGERAFVSAVYDSIQQVLGSANCLQIGSFPRFTAITPLHDLDVLYILGDWDPSATDPSRALTDLEARLRASYRNPTSYTLEIARQTHSITLQFVDQEEEVFSVDIVPAYVSGRNEFGADMYVVPEIAAKSHGDRRRIIAEIAKGAHQMEWIASDPRGYIAVAARLNQANEDFRKAVKLIKGWRSSCKDMDDEFPLKSFHLEQVVTRLFQRDPNIQIFDAVFRFFCDLPQNIEQGQIPDRADPQKNINSYVENLTRGQRDQILQARDHFLIQLENLSSGDDVGDLLSADLYRRVSSTEAFLFDAGIPMLTEQEFGIVATVLERSGGFRRRILDALGIIDVNRRIEFRIGQRAPQADLYKWKVRNDDNCRQPRGEISDHRTQNDPEETRFNGQHYVECFAIRNGVCVGRSRQNVVLQWAYGT